MQSILRFFGRRLSSDGSDLRFAEGIIYAVALLVLVCGFRPGSDLDILVEFEPGRRISLFDLGGMASELSGLLGREVDLRTPQDLSRHFRDDVVRNSRPLYAA